MTTPRTVTGRQRMLAFLTLAADLLLLVAPLAFLLNNGGMLVVAHVPDLHALDHQLAGDRWRPKHPVLICNPWSGGGKVEKFGLLERARELGVDTVLLDHGLDLEQLARDAIAGGADCLGMAGGDGSQALVASIAIEHDLPFVCVAAGTRNHFALDLGWCIATIVQQDSYCDAKCETSRARVQVRARRGPGTYP